MDFNKNRKRSGRILTGVVLCSGAISAMSQGVVGAVPQSYVANNAFKSFAGKDIKNSSGTLLNFFKNHWGWVLIVGLVLIGSFTYIIFSYNKIKREKKLKEEEQERANNIKSGYDDLFVTNKNVGDKISVNSDHGRMLSDIEKLGDDSVKGIFYMSEDEAKEFLAEGIDFSLEKFFSKEELDAMRNNKDYIEEINEVKVKKAVPPKRYWKKVDHIELNENGEPTKVYSSEEREYSGVYHDNNVPFYNIFNEKGKIRFALMSVEDEESFGVELPDGNEEKGDPARTKYSEEELKNFKKIRDAKASDVGTKKEQYNNFNKTEISKKTFHFFVGIIGKVKDEIKLSEDVPRYNLFNLGFCTKDLKNDGKAIFSFLNNSFMEAEKIYGKDSDGRLVMRENQIKAQYNKKWYGVDKFVQLKKEEEEKERKQADGGADHNVWGLLHVKDGSQLTSEDKYGRLKKMEGDEKFKKGVLWSEDKNFDGKWFDINKNDVDDCYLHHYM